MAELNNSVMHIDNCKKGQPQQIGVFREGSTFVVDSVKNANSSEFKERVRPLVNDTTRSRDDAFRSAKEMDFRIEQKK